ncbi:phosphodiester glycosidase family protein [Vibrio sp. S12_S33]|uniref:phosphodiester glycosidase family protein n=1 Tax=Vibrio sp. S12_S33 TaxID=2720223 RepID=UPI001783AE06|nr:phosphodiester glycosidase family protein [Vibrio sp. S12_S33]MBD1567250.1 phosphodiester glycosidase family protein [Vibrio sp. S12_S33]
MKYSIIAAACLFSFSTFAWDVPDLLIGKEGLNQQVQHVNLSQGIDLYNVVRGYSSKEGFLLSSGPLDKGALDDYKAKLLAASQKFSLEDAPELTPEGKKIDSILRVRGFKTLEDAKNALSKFKAKGLNFSVRAAAQDGYPTTGPFEISLLRVDLSQYKGQINTILAQDHLIGGETVTSIASRLDAIAAINGGFFAFNDKVGDLGAPAGIFVRDGSLVREAANGRPVVVFDNTGKSTKVDIATSVTSQIQLKINNEQSIQVDGMNRKPGVILNCGGYGDTPTNQVVHDFVCQDEDEVIVYEQSYGGKTPSGDGSEIVINSKGKVVDIRDFRGSQIEPGMMYIQSTGQKALKITKSDSVTLNTIVSIEGEEVTLKPGISMFSAGPTLIADSNFASDYRANQGWSAYPPIGVVKGGQDDDGIGGSAKSENRENFYNGWVLRRHPRSALGITQDNILYAAVVYGRQPGQSEGANITEMSKLMIALGADKAINLDGGGSSMMVANGTSTGNSSDSVERKVSDAIVFLKE